MKQPYQTVKQPYETLKQTHTGPEHRTLWLASGILLLALFFAGWANLKYMAEHWEETFYSPADYFPLKVVLVFGIAAGIVAWQVIELGRREERKRREISERYLRALEEAYNGVLHTLNLAIDLRDHETYGHSRRVLSYAIAVGKRMELTLEQLRSLSWGSVLHDLGKIGIPDQILQKPGPLDDAERALMTEHVIIGCQLIQSLPLAACALDVIRYHHERFDGRGYPEGKSGMGIPLVARIFALADTLDAMTSPRPYRPEPYSLEDARKMIAGLAGGQLCPEAVQVFLSIPLVELEAIRMESFLPLSLATDGFWLDLLPLNEGRVDPATMDHMTRALNRNAWEAKRGQLALLAGPRLGTVVFLDIDGLKEVNDRFGHPKGDRLIIDLASRLLCLGYETYRYGGDEFLLWIPPGANSVQLRAKLEEMARSYSAYWSHLVSPLEVSWGMAAAVRQTQLVDELVEEADAAMYAQRWERKVRQLPRRDSL